MESKKHGRSELDSAALYWCSEGHMVTPAALVVMEIHGIPCPMCECEAINFTTVPVEDHPTTSDEYGQKVMEADEVILYGRKEDENE